MKALQTDYIDFGFIHCIDIKIRQNTINTVADNGGKENNEVYKFRKIGFESVPHLYGVYGIWRCGCRTA